MKLSLGVVVFCITLLSTSAFAQWAEKPMTGSPEQMLADRTNMSGMSGMVPALEAGLVQQHRNAAEKKAVVRAEVWGVNLVQPQEDAEPSREKAYLSYVLDRNAPVNTTEKEYTFENLLPGWHTITAQLMSTDHLPLGAKVVMTFKVPQ